MPENPLFSAISPNVLSKPVALILLKPAPGHARLNKDRSAALFPDIRADGRSITYHALLPV